MVRRASHTRIPHKTGLIVRLWSCGEISRRCVHAILMKSAGESGRKKEGGREGESSRWAVLPAVAQRWNEKRPSLVLATILIIYRELARHRWRTHSPPPSSPFFSTILQSLLRSNEKASRVGDRESSPLDPSAIRSFLPSTFLPPRVLSELRISGRDERERKKGKKTQREGEDDGASSVVLNKHREEKLCVSLCNR